MSRRRSEDSVPSPESVISIIAPGAKVVGDLDTPGTVRVEGLVEGSVQAGKAVVVSRGGVIHGNVDTQDAVISGTVVGAVTAASRLELQATGQVDGDVCARTMLVEEGARLNGSVSMQTGDALPGVEPAP